MQTTRAPSGALHSEFFPGEDDAQLEGQMEERLSQLTGQGHKLMSRRKVSRNEPCPCGTGKKFKNCCCP